MNEPVAPRTGTTPAAIAAALAMALTGLITVALALGFGVLPGGLYNSQPAHPGLPASGESPRATPYRICILETADGWPCQALSQETGRPGI